MATTTEDISVEELSSPPPPIPPLTRKIFSPTGRETNEKSRTPTLKAFRGIWQAKVKPVNQNVIELQQKREEEKRVFVSPKEEDSPVSISSQKAPSVFQIDLDASELSDKHSDSTVQVKVTRPRQLWQPLSSWKRRNKVVPSPQAKQKVSAATEPLSSNKTLNDKENLGPSSSPPPPPPPPPLHPLRRKMEKLNITSSEDLLSTFTPVSPLYQQPEEYSTPIASPLPQTLNTPEYSKIKKKNKKQEHPPPLSPPSPPYRGDNPRYAQSFLSSPSSLVPETVNNNVIKVLSLSDDKDSLYESLLEDPEAHTYSEVIGSAPTGHVQLISIKGRQSDEILDEGASMEAGALPSPFSSTQMLPIHHAAAKGDKKELAEVLGQLPMIQDPVERVLGSKKFCVREGVDVKDGEGRTALMHAVHNDHTDCVQLLIKAGANINIEATDGSTCLHEGAYSGSLKMVALLLSLGADGMKKDNDGRLPLHWGTNNYNSDCVNILLDKVPGLSPNEVDGSQMTPLMWAGFHGRPDNMELLKQRGADPGLVDCEGMSALHWSVKSRDLKTLQLLLTPESVGLQDVKGKTVMHFIAENGFSKAVPIVKGTSPLNINDTDHNKRTALHWATVCEKPDVIRALLAAGADSNIQDTQGMTPLDYALKKRLPYCALLLTQAQDVKHHEEDDDRAGINYRHILSLGESTGIGVRTLLQQEGKVIDQELVNGKLSAEHTLQMKAVCTGAWINKFTASGRGPLHPRFLWIDPTTMNIFWSKNVESRYISSKETKNDKFIGVRCSASRDILRRKDFDPVTKHKFAFTIFTKNKILNVVALSSEDFKTWLNGLQMILNLGSEKSVKVINARPSLRNY